MNQPVQRKMRRRSMKSMNKLNHFKVILIASLKKIGIIFATSVFKGIKWFLWEFCGLHYIIHKLLPLSPQKEQEEKPPVTIGLWFIGGFLGVYSAFYSIASSRYESNVSVIANRMNSIISQIQCAQSKKALELIPETQHMRCPIKPEIVKISDVMAITDSLGFIKLANTFASTFISLFGNDSIHKETVDLGKLILKIYKDTLVNLNFQEIDLGYTILPSVNFSNATLINSNLSYSDLSYGVLYHANLSGAICTGIILREAHLDSANLSLCNFSYGNFIKSDLSYTNLTGSFLTGADFTETNFHYANLYKAVLSGAILTNSQGLTVAQLKSVKTLYKAEIPTELLLINNRVCFADKMATIFDSTKNTWVVDQHLLSVICAPNWHAWDTIE